MKTAQRLRQERTLHHKLLRLRELLLEGTELASVSQYFHDRLVPDEGFMAAGSCLETPRVIGAVQAVLGSLAPGREPSHVFSIRLLAERFSHGFLTWGQGVVIFAYFEDLDLGFLSYAPQLTDPNVTFARFTVTSLPTGAFAAGSKRGSA
jgi:hypothetical protein